MKNPYELEHMREIVARAAWELRKAYAKKDVCEFRYQLRKFTGYYLLGFLSESAYHRIMQMVYAMN